jgi:hypothetical protein
MGKIRCPLRPASMKLERKRPEILTPPGHPPACCTQQTITVPPQTCAKTAQKHDCPSKSPPSNSGETSWSADQVELFRNWITDGYQA